MTWARKMIPRSSILNGYEHGKIPFTKVREQDVAVTETQDDDSLNESFICLMDREGCNFEMLCRKNQHKPKINLRPGPKPSVITY